jgi:hypothetical protein
MPVFPRRSTLVAMFVLPLLATAILLGLLFALTRDA